MGGGGFLTMKWSRIGISPKSFALEHDSLVSPTLNPKEPLRATNRLLKRLLPQACCLLKRRDPVDPPPRNCCGPVDVTRPITSHLSRFTFLFPPLREIFLRLLVRVDSRFLFAACHAVACEGGSIRGCYSRSASVICNLFRQLPDHSRSVAFHLCVFASLREIFLRLLLRVDSRFLFAACHAVASEGGSIRGCYSRSAT
jgi:hypothetical protein